MRLWRTWQPILAALALAAFPFVLVFADDKRAVIFELGLMLPYVLAAIIGYSSLKLSQRRLFYFAASIALAYAVLQLPAWRDFLGLTQSGAATVLAIALPITFLCLFLVPETHGPWLPVLTYFAVVISPTLIVASLYRFGPPLVQELLHWRGTGLGSLTTLPGAGVFLAIAFAATTTLTTDRFLRDFRLYAAVACLPLYLLLERVSRVAVPTSETALELILGFLSVGIVCLAGVFRLYWQKVYVDELTGIPNRRALNERLNRLRGRFSIAMTDIDHFKRFNDTYGHEEGDHVLRYVAKHLNEASGGNAYRYGGEEICVVLQDKTAAAATKLMDRIRHKLAEREFVVRSPKKVRAKTSDKDRDKQSEPRKKVHVTISAGVAAASPSLRRPEDVLIAADAALYRAKELGRDRVLMAQIGAPEDTPDAA